MGARPNPERPPVLERHVLGLIDRRVERINGEVVLSDHSAKPNTYASADLRHLYAWDGVSLRLLDRRTMKPHNEGHS